MNLSVVKKYIGSKDTRSKHYIIELDLYMVYNEFGVYFVNNANEDKTSKKAIIEHLREKLYDVFYYRSNSGVYLSKVKYDFYISKVIYLTSCLFLNRVLPNKNYDILEKKLCGGNFFINPYEDQKYIWDFTGKSSNIHYWNSFIPDNLNKNILKSRYISNEELLCIMNDFEYHDVFEPSDLVEYSGVVNLNLIIQRSSELFANVELLCDDVVMCDKHGDDMKIDLRKTLLENMLYKDDVCFYMEYKTMISNVIYQRKEIQKINSDFMKHAIYVLSFCNTFSGYRKNTYHNNIISLKYNTILISTFSKNNMDKTLLEITGQGTYVLSNVTSNEEELYIKRIISENNFRKRKDLIYEIQPPLYFEISENNYNDFTKNTKKKPNFRLTLGDVTWLHHLIYMLHYVHFRKDCDIKFIRWCCGTDINFILLKSIVNISPCKLDDCKLLSIQKYIDGGIQNPGEFHPILLHTMINTFFNQIKSGFMLVSRWPNVPSSLLEILIRYYHITLKTISNKLVILMSGFYSDNNMGSHEAYVVYMKHNDHFYGIYPDYFCIVKLFDSSDIPNMTVSVYTPLLEFEKKLKNTRLFSIWNDF